MAVNAIATAISEGFKLLKTVLDTKETRKMIAAKEAAEQYIFVDEKSGEHKDISEDRQKKLKKHYRKRFFTYN